MAKVLGFQAEEIRAALPKVMAFFTISGEDIFSAELDAYRAHLAGIRRAKSDGGRQGAAATNKMRQKAGKS
jgi:hypothetical protein